MSKDFRKLGLDRLSTAITQSTSNVVSTSGPGLTVGDISAGSVFVAEFYTEGVAPGKDFHIQQRRTGAAIIGMDLNPASTYVNWSVSGKTLNVVLSGDTAGTITFWIF